MELTHYQKYKDTIMKSQKKHYEKPENLEKRRERARKYYHRNREAYLKTQAEKKWIFV